MKNIRLYLFFYYFFFLSFSAYSQHSTVKILGKVVESDGRQPVEFATVLVADKESDKAITGVTTIEDGTFEIKVSHSNFYVEVSFIGFVSQRIEDFSIEDGVINLNTIILKVNNQNLDEITVTAERSSTEFKLDKRVFNVGKDLGNSGASALEVLNNVPSVEVNIEGQISLRGSQGVQILINGKPSVLSSDGANALGTITAEMIEKIEVITNPSAKYDAEGTSGILNIVLKENDKKGLNGAVTLNTGIPNNHSIGLSLNNRTEKFNLFTQLGVGHRTNPNDSERISHDLLSDQLLNRLGNSEKNETFYNIVLGTDYHISSNDVITLSGRFAFEEEEETSDNDFAFSQNGNREQEWNRLESTTATNPKWQYELQYKKDFKDHKERDLLFSALGNFFGKDQSSTFNDETSLGMRDNFTQKTATDFKEAQYTFKLDYTHPFAEKYTIETGAQYLLNDVGNDYEVSSLEDGEFVLDPNFTNFFEYQQGVVGVYTTLAFEEKKWGAKAGLRYENTKLNTLLRNTGEENDDDYSNFFPSFHTSYNVNDKVSFQAGYSKRIFRPRLWDLNPFFNIRDNFNIFTGNPDLQPELTDSYEITGIYAGEKLSMNFGVYHRYTTDVVEDIITFQDNVSLRMPLNIGTNKTTGLEYNMKYNPIKWATVMADFNYNNFVRNGEFSDLSFDFSGNRWTSKITTKFKLPAQTDLEVSGRYNSKFKTVQGEQNSNYFVNLGIRKKILKGKIILNLSIRDVFATRRWESTTDQPDFYLYSNRQRGRFTVFGVSYGFGKGEAMEFSGHKRF